jgi:hypothetical protein
MKTLAAIIRPPVGPFQILYYLMGLTFARPLLRPHVSYFTFGPSNDGKTRPPPHPRFLKPRRKAARRRTASEAVPTEGLPAGPPLPIYAHNHACPSRTLPTGFIAPSHKDGEWVCL